MEQNDLFDQAIKDTILHRKRKTNLYTFGTTRLPYIFLANSSINEHDVVVRAGEIHADKPQIIMPGSTHSHFEGFDEMCNEMGIESEQMQMILMARRVRFPQMNYRNNQNRMDVIEGPLERVLEAETKKLDNGEDTRTALISGPEATSALSIMIYVSKMIEASSQGNIDELMERNRF